MRQPKTLFILSFLQMLKFFSHYGMRALLVLYMVQSLLFSDQEAYGINAVFCGLVELGGIFGGLLADRLLGLRRALIFGTLLLSLGYLGLLFEDGFFIALGLIVMGGGLFSGNLLALLGASYLEKDARREKGFTFLYMMQNLGAFISTLLCGVAATYWGFRVGFAFAASGMLVGNLVLFLSRDLLPYHPKKGKTRWLAPLSIVVIAALVLGISYGKTVLPLLPWLTMGFFAFFALKLWRNSLLPKPEVRTLLIFLGTLILFFAAQDQICSSLVIFSERETNRSFLGWQIPSSIIVAINPIVILLFGTVMTAVTQKMKLFRITLPLTIVALAFGVVAFVSLKQIAFSFFGIMGIVVLISLAELMVGPFIYSFASQIAGKGSPGMVMGMVQLSFSIAFLLGGSLSKLVAVEENANNLVSYGTGFAAIALILLVGGCVLELLMKRVSDGKSLIYR